MVSVFPSGQGDIMWFGRQALGGILHGDGRLIVSGCCKNDFYAVHTESGSGHYICRKCEMPCHPLLINEYTPINYRDDENGNVQSST